MTTAIARHPAPNPYTSEIVASRNPSQASANYTYSNATTGRNDNVIVITRGGDYDEAVADVVAQTNRETQKLLRQGGHTLHRTDGGRVWRVREPITDLSQERPEYTWHEDGERVRCRWSEITMDADGTRTERDLRSVWVIAANAFND